jgi:hypothetical protein
MSVSRAFNKRYWRRSTAAAKIRTMEQASLDSTARQNFNLLAAAFGLTRLL